MQWYANLTYSTRKIWGNLINESKTTIYNYRNLVARLPRGECPFEFHQKDDRCLAFLIDGSKSITSSEFARSTSVIRETVEHATGLGILSTSIFQFSDYPLKQLEWTPTMGPHEIVNRILQIDHIQQNGGNSDIMAALETTGDLLSKYDYKTVVLCTDGVANRQTLVKGSRKMLKNFCFFCHF